MKDFGVKKGFTLTELLVVVAVISLLVGIGITAAKGLLESFESSKGVKNVISAALSSARAMALKESQYAGVRFQADVNGNYYLILIINDEDKTGLVNGFRAIEGRKPIKLPGDVGAMDLRIKNDYFSPGTWNELDVLADGDIDGDAELTDAGTFSIVFSKAGKIVTHYVRIRNDEGATDDSSNDRVFNTMTNVDNGIGIFYQDDYASDGLFEEYSRNSFIVYSKRDFLKADVASRYTSLLQYSEKIYVNPYTGEIVID